MCIRDRASRFSRLSVPIRAGSSNIKTHDETVYQAKYDTEFPIHKEEYLDTIMNKKGAWHERILSWVHSRWNPLRDDLLYNSFY